MLLLHEELQRKVSEHCQREYPREACGLLAAARDDAGGTIVQVYPMTNVEDSPISYAMDPKEQLQVDKQMRSRGQRLIGIYHSHTASEAYPSSVDIGLAISPDVSYVLVSLKNRQQPVLKSYRIHGTVVTPEEIRSDL